MNAPDRTHLPRHCVQHVETEHGDGDTAAGDAETGDTDPGDRV